MFSEREVAVVQKIATKASLTDADRELVPGLKEKLGAESQGEIPDKFVAVTGWSNMPKDYPL